MYSRYEDSYQRARQRKLLGHFICYKKSIVQVQIVV